MKKLSAIVFVFIYACSDRTAGPVYIDTDSMSTETYELRDSLAASIDALDSLKPVVNETLEKIKYYEALRNDYEKEVVKIRYKPVVDSSQVASLRKKLNDANKEIAKLRGDLAAVERSRYVRPDDVYSAIEPGIAETPDDNSIVINFDGRSKNGNLFTDRLVVYLIPYTKKAKQHMRYETSCDESLYGNTQAKYYNGVYYFNDVQAGKYLIKVCTYYGNFKLVNKYTGRVNITMQVSPPIQ